jgi:signal transduction histidine kinase
MPHAPASGGWRDRLSFSIKGRLVALFVLLALGTTTVFLAGMQRWMHTGWQAYVQPLASDYAARLAADLGTPPDIARARALSERLPIAIRIEGPLVQFDSQPRRPWGRRLAREQGHGPMHAAGPDEGNDDEALSDAWGFVQHTADGHRITFALARPSDGLRARVRVGAMLLALLLLTAMAYGAVRRLLAPLHDIGAGVEAYGRGEFGQAIAVRRHDELGALATRINGMANNLHGMLDAKRALLLAISHELRSPLTRARLNAELLDDSAPRQALLYDLAEMRDLITNLLESERLAQGHAALQAEPTDLAALVRDLAAGAFEGRALDLQLDEVGGPVRVDPTRLRLLLRNLIDNALRHGGAGGNGRPPTVFLRREADGRLALGVRDRGPGVAAEHLAQLGEPFYRPDAARARSSGGTGLGLALCRLVAQAHGGELRIRSAELGLEVSAVWSPLR